MTNEISLLNFFRKNKISPLRQEIRDLCQYFEKREALHRKLGIFPVFIRGRTVLEVAWIQGKIFTASLKPEIFFILDFQTVNSIFYWRGV